MEKSEFDKMPQGMSGEELDVLISDEEAPEVIAQEALDATAPPAGESVKDETKAEENEEKVVEVVEEEAEEELSETDQQLRAKDSKIASLKYEKRDLEIERARLEGELEGRKSVQGPAVKPKSPLEIAEAAYLEENGSLEGFAMDGELYRQQRAFDDKQAATETAAGQEEQAITKMNRSISQLQAGDLSPETVGDGVDFKSVIALGKGYLQPSDLLKIEETAHAEGIPASVRKTYELCKAAILAANNQDSILLQNAIKIKSQTKPKKQTQTDVDAIIEGGDTNKGEAETDIPESTRLANFVCNP